MTLGAHFLDDLNDQAIIDAALPGVGLSGAKDWRALRTFLNPLDSEADMRGYALGYPNATPPIRPQSHCNQYLCAAARLAGKSGVLDDFDGRKGIDFFRIPQRGIPGVAPATNGRHHLLLEKLAAQHGILERTTPYTRPDFRPGTAVLIGGNDGLPPAQQIYGGLVHGLLIRGQRDDGLFDTLEGGQGPVGTDILAKVRELHPVGTTWWIRSPGDKGNGRMVRWYFRLGALPNV